MFISYIEKKMLLIFRLVNASVSKYVVCSKLNCYCRWIKHLNKLFYSSEDSHLQMPVLTAGNSTRVKPYTIFYLHGNRSMTSNYTNTKTCSYIQSMPLCITSLILISFPLSLIIFLLSHSLFPFLKTSCHRNSVFGQWSSYLFLKT